MNFLWAALLLSPAFAADAPNLPSHYALSLYHWNIQYVSGSPRTEDEIVREAFRPVLELYAKHPSWKATFELQGYMIEVLAARFPDALARLREMNQRGQIELVSFHYSDQLVLGFPRADELKSLEINDQVFAENGLKLSPVVFVQEDQMSEGIADLMRRRGDRIAVVIGGWDEFHGDPPAPYYRWSGVDLVKIQKWNADGPRWVFVGDAEQAGTNMNSTPYFAYMHLGLFFRKSDSALKDLENNMASLEKDHEISTIEEYVNAMREAGVEPAPTGKILDKCRTMGMSNSCWRWLGDNSFPLPGGEDDVKVRSLNYKSRQELLAAETFVKEAKSRGLNVASQEKLVGELWREQLMAEVSDASGLGTPFPIEVNTSLNQSRDVIIVSDAVIDSLKTIEGRPRVRIDTQSGRIEDLSALGPPPEEAFALKSGPIKVDVSGPVFSDVKWRKIDENTWQASVTFWPVIPRLCYRCTTVGVRFPRSTADVIYSPALLEDQISDDPISAFNFKKMFLPLTNGLIGLGKDTYVIKHNIQNHVAAEIDTDSKWISFTTRNPTLEISGHRWLFTIFQGSAQDAVALADRINVSPVVDR